jgi:CBS domain-containing protein
MKDLPISADDPPAVILELMYRLKIKDVMTKELITVTKTTSFREIQHLMKKEGITGVPVVADTKRLVGVVSMDDIIQALDKGYIEEPCERYMSRNLIVLEEDMPLSFAVSYFDKYSFHRFPVLNKENQLAGIITTRDITARLLLEANREIERLERNIQHEIVPGKQISLRFLILKQDFENAGKASTEIKRSLKLAEIDPKLTRRVAIAAYELEMNQVLHSEGGTIRFSTDEEKAVIEAKDSGPGIEDVEQALKPGYSTANEWIRSLGFGAGMGLPNAKKVSDEFFITSSMPEGTTVRATIYLNPKEERNENQGS